MQIADYLDIPERPDLDRFITRLGTDDTDTVRRHLREFVVTDRLKSSLDELLGSVGERLAQNKDIGRFLFGSFGSGKSHLMTVLSRMFEHDPAVYDLGHSHLRSLRADHPWVDSRRLLVVRLNMMSKESLTQGLYDAFNAALPEGKRVDFTDEARVFTLFDRDVDRLGGVEVALRSVIASGVLSSLDGFPPVETVDELRPLLTSWRAHHDRHKRLSLAAALETWRNHGEARVRPEDLWVAPSAGMQRMAHHAQALGYDAIVYLVDELVIWLRGKSGLTYVDQINTLSAMVDHDTPRTLPFFVLVAVQTDIAETCPSDLSESGFRAQLAFVANRFQPSLHLEEQDLFEVCRQRVLAPRADLSLAARQAYESAVAAKLQGNETLVSQLSGGLDPATVRGLYPFHPATLRVLVDVTQALSRNRTAIAALYGLLDRHRTLAVGQFLPLATLWDILFTPDNVQAIRNNVRSELSVRLASSVATWERLDGKIGALEADPEVGTANVAALRSTVRAALLCQLSDRKYYPDGRSLREGLTSGILYAFSQADVQVRLAATAGLKVRSNLRKLSGLAPEVTVGPGDDPRVEIRTRTVDVERVLASARAKIEHHHRFAYARGIIRDTLGLPFTGDATDGMSSVLWRGTDRRGRVVLRNVRTAPYAGQSNEFDVGRDAFRILVDYPFDEDPTCDRQHDLDTAQRARARGAQWTVCWLPTHLTAPEKQALDNAAACDLIRNDKSALSDYSPNDQAELRSQLESFQGSRRAELESAFRRVYFKDGMLFGMAASLDQVDLPTGDPNRALEGIAKQILDKRYPRHPTLGRKIGVPELNEMAQWAIRAAQTGQSTTVPKAQQGLVDQLAVPLGLVYAGQGAVTAKPDGEYLSAIRGWASQRGSSFDATDLQQVLAADDGWQFGFNDAFQSFWLYWLLQVEGYEAQQRGGTGVTVEAIDKLPKGFRLVKDEVVDAPTWDRGRAAAEKLLNIKGRAELPSPPEQSKLARDAVVAATKDLAAVRAFLGALDEVLTWASVAPAESKRRQALVALMGWLEELTAEQGNAAIVRRLAKLQVASNFATLTTVREKLASELAGLRDIDGGKMAYETVSNYGTPDEKQVVVSRLTGYLIDDWTTTSLTKVGRQWATDAATCLKAVLVRLKPPVVPPPDPGPAPTPPTTMDPGPKPQSSQVFEGRGPELMHKLEGAVTAAAGRTVRVTVEVLDE